MTVVLLAKGQVISILGFLDDKIPAVAVYLLLFCENGHRLHTNE